jgi:hypothetical protein
MSSFVLKLKGRHRRHCLVKFANHEALPDFSRAAQPLHIVQKRPKAEVEEAKKKKRVEQPPKTQEWTWHVEDDEGSSLFHGVENASQLSDLCGGSNRFTYFIVDPEQSEVLHPTPPSSPKFLIFSLGCCPLRPSAARMSFFERRSWTSTRRRRSQR